MIDLSLTVSGTPREKQFSVDSLGIAQFREMLGDWAPAFQSLAGGVLEAYVERQFESEGAAGGTQWQELAPATLKSRRHAHSAILDQSGALARSFLEGGDHVEEIDATHMVWGSARTYALYHQTGTGKGFGQDRVVRGPGTGRGMPRRQMLVITKAMTNEILTAMQARLVQIARQVGFGILGRGATPGEARFAGMKQIGFGA